jgi:diguanylate cyclase (GGDEF)-like protein
MEALGGYAGKSLGEFRIDDRWISHMRAEHGGLIGRGAHQAGAPGLPLFEAARPFQGCESFEGAASLVADLLRRYSGVRCWYVLRRLGSGWAAVGPGDRQLGAADAQLFADVLHAALGKWPEEALPLLIAPLGNVRLSSQIATEEPAPAYLLGAPLIGAHRLDGFLCGVTHVIPYSEIERHRALIASSLRLLNGLSARDAQVRAYQSQVGRSQARMLRDQLTGLLNRRGWELFTWKEEVRIRRYNRSATLFAIDLTGWDERSAREGPESSERLLQVVAAALVRVMRSSDIIARVDTAEFGILAVESDDASALRVRERLRTELELAGVHASIGEAQVGVLTAMDSWRRAQQKLVSANGDPSPDRGVYAT